MIIILASTGIAACNISGTTLHSFAGIGLGQGDLSALMNNLYKNRKACKRWELTRVLIIDEGTERSCRFFKLFFSHIKNKNKVLFCW